MQLLDIQLSLFFMAMLMFIQMPLEAQNDPELEKHIIELKTLTDQQQMDSVHRMAEGILAKARSTSSQILEIKNIQAFALEVNDKDEEALRLIYEVQEEAEKSLDWENLAESFLNLARLQEKIQRRENAQLALDKALALIEQHNLAYSRPRYHIRQSSLYRVSGKNDEALVHANKAYELAPVYGDNEDFATSRMLKAYTDHTLSGEQRISVLNEAAERYAKMQNWGAHAFMLNATANYKAANRKLEQALGYSRESLQSAKKAVAANPANEEALYIMHEEYSHMLARVGRYKEAFAHRDSAAILQARAIVSEQNEKIVQIENNYQSEIYQNELSENKSRLKSQKIISRLFGIIALLLALAGITGMLLYQRQKRSSRLIEKQKTELERNQADIEDSLERQRSLTAELHHRVKNNLQVIISLLELQGNNAENKKEQTAYSTMADRLMSMADIHQMLYVDTRDHRKELYPFVKKLFDNFSALGDETLDFEYHLDINMSDIGEGHLMPLGIILHELLVNSHKYGRDPQGNLEVSISIQEISDQKWKLIYQDNGDGRKSVTDESDHKGLGTYLINSMVRQMLGTWKREEGPGMRYIMEFPK